jgi:peptidoglycan/xylan/chitin deacetylase (PgdA/CDA1 family)
MRSNSNINLLFHEVCKIEDCSKTGFNYKENRNYSCDIDVFHEIVRFSFNNKLDINFSFDDGGVSNLLASRILEEFNYKGTFFIPTYYIGTSGFLSKEDICDLYNRGHIIGSHSHTHPIPISTLNYDSQLLEWGKSKAVLEEIIKDKITIAALPGGDSNFDTTKILQDLGFLELYTSYPDATYEKQIENLNVKGRVCFKRHHDLLFFEKLINNRFLTYKLVLNFRIKEIIKKKLKFIFIYSTKNRKHKSICN